MTITELIEKWRAREEQHILTGMPEEHVYQLLREFQADLLALQAVIEHRNAPPAGEPGGGDEP
jgi:hypothetical protein